MIKRLMVFPDVHLNTAISQPYAIARHFLKEYKPDELILLGDFLDCNSLSHWLDNKKLTMENKRFMKEIDFANIELDFLAKHTKKIVYLEGNHEDWIDQYLEKHPELQGLIEIPHKLKLEERGIEWHEMNQMYKVGKLYLTHGFYITKYHACKNLHTLGCNICYGHSHNAQTYQINMKMQEPFMAYGLGCLCDHEPYYMKGRPCNWINQLAVIDVDTQTGQFNLTPINIIRGALLFNGEKHTW